MANATNQSYAYECGLHVNVGVLLPSKLEPVNLFNLMKLWFLIWITQNTTWWNSVVFYQERYELYVVLGQNLSLVWVDYQPWYTIMILMFWWSDHGSGGFFSGLGCIRSWGGIPSFDLDDFPVMCSNELNDICLLSSLCRY